MREEPLDDVHHRAAVAVGLVELEDRELGVVRAVEALVAEVAADLEDLVEAADDEALEVELRRDAQEHVAVERVVVRREGLRGGAAGVRLEDGRLDLHEAAGLEPAARLAQDRAALVEAVARLGVGEEVDVAAAVAVLGVREAVELLGRLAEGLGEERPRGDADRELAGAGHEELALAADVVAEVQELERGEGVVAAGLRVHEELDAAGAVAQVGEDRLAHLADGEEAAGGADLRAGRSLPVRTPRLGGGGLGGGVGGEEGGAELADAVEGSGALEGAAEWLVAERLELPHVLDADGAVVGGGGRFHGGGRGV